MAILSGIPVLNCQFFTITLDFYRRMLQFVVVNQRQSNGVVQWVHLMHGDVTLMLQRVPPSQMPQPEPLPRSRITLYFYLNNIKELHHFIAANGVSVSDLSFTDYKIQEFSLLDPEGNKIILGQAINKA